MAQKAKIQYIGEFYTHGSEARKVDIPAKPKQRARILRFMQPSTVREIPVDPYALVAIVVAVVMLATMALGVAQLNQDWDAYNRASEHLHEANEANREKLVQYRQKFNMEEIRMKAEAMGLVPKSEVQTISITVHVPQPEPARTFFGDIVWFVKGMFA